LFAVLVANASTAAVFVVPDDRELVGKAEAIVTGTINGSHVRELADGFETVYTVRVEQILKGLTSTKDLEVVSPGGSNGQRFTLVQGAAHFKTGDHVLLFLSQHRGEWTTTDWTLGKFRFLTSTGGQSLLVRDAEDIVGFDRQMRPYTEPVRRETEFLRFIRETVRGRETATTSYFLDAKDAVAIQDEIANDRFRAVSNVVYTADSYAIQFTDGISYWPGRWPSTRMSASVAQPFLKNSAQSASGLGDGGVGLLTNALASWNNDCSSVVNAPYGGTTALLKNGDDKINVVIWNDPGGDIGGTWSGSGIVATAFSNGDVFHTFASRTDWISLSDGDIVVQNGITGGETMMPVVMTHELGHAFGLRHSNTHATGSGCLGTDECTGSAVMNSSAMPAYNYTLQPWDMTAIAALYPGGSCCTAVSISSNPANVTITAGQSTLLSVTATGTGPFTYQWYTGTSGNTASPIGGATSNTVLVSPTSTTSYWVRVTGCSASTANSTTATVTVNPALGIAVRRDINGDGRSDVFWRNVSTGLNSFWYMNGGTFTSVAVPTVPLPWEPAVVGDFNGDGKADIFWRNTSTGQTSIWIMNGATYSQAVAAATIADLNWLPIGSGDFNGDGKADILWRNASTGVNSIWIMNGITYSGLASPTVPAPWAPVLIGDFDGDGKSDIFWRSAATGETSIWIMNGATYTSAVRSITVADLNWEPVRSGDFNADGRFDILWRNNSTGVNSIWLMNGISTPVTATSPSAPTTWTPRVVGDYNGDGKADLFWWNSTTGQTSVWLMNGANPTSTPALPTVADTNWRPVSVK
jgi:hypothetical protein